MLKPETLGLELPVGYRWVQGGRGLMAVWADASEGLRSTGFGPDSDGSMRVSDAVGRRALGELSTGSEVYLVRCFSHGGLLRWLTGARYRDPRRPFEELLLSHSLSLAGVRTPRVIAARAQRVGPWWELALVTERVEGTTDIGRWIAELRRGERTRLGLDRVLYAAGELVRELHEAGFLHADLQPNNLLVEEPLRAERAPSLWVVDLDRSERASSLSPSERRTNLTRLARFVERRERERGACLTRADRMRFLRGYEPDRELRSELWRSLASALQKSGRHGLGWILERAFGGADAREG
ncbi:MAG: lipopolysaccharide kinase InaA family protein [Planctomycetes bacterium]|nr:lipopolysaccharide kinase InaA family protein [Planctomycetota bacterium]